MKSPREPERARAYELAVTARLAMLISDLDIRIVHAATGEILRHLTLDPTLDYQPTGKPPRPPPKPTQPEPQ
jgi:hypothetical protein